ncbi:3-oxoacyl-ACP reductase FabG [Enterobacteriaceae endosymbiont of Macroplea appendiculata]|uniref:3-oxoacyl-ACP reductase FabG n=1 Tax=Enterobacteriaceae endosymbiont of Macroplea appendiculata TaxID=2675790 RepID=UPI001448D283|nr:3-oxoacyl-ACP reductase FabG [Enterobacteriaceae endosymbiont of Macroplea appendiculata]QJC30706.1 SDR family oxidoreductase [Enterobacteriaceae endosymbiont of Macroplea appendiculata]
MNFKNQIALVTGASRGIGYNIAKTLAYYGAYVIGTATNNNGVKIINDTLKKQGIGQKLNFIKDNHMSINNIIQYIINNFGKIDILINNAGIINDHTILTMSEHDWDVTLKINLTAIFQMSKIVVKYMLQKSFGRIINISSVIGHIGNIGQTNYAASKAGIIGFSKSLAQEVANQGITVNIVSPGYINTDMTRNIPKNKIQNIISKIPMKRFGTVQDVTNTVMFLCSRKTSYITGETIHVNGGLYMT